MAQYLGEKFLEKYEVIGNIIGIRKFQKNPSKTHSGSTNSYKIGEKIFLIKKLGKKMNWKYMSLRRLEHSSDIGSCGLI